MGTYTALNQFTQPILASSSFTPSGQGEKMIGEGVFMPKEKASDKWDGIRNPFIDLEPFLAEELKETEIHFEDPKNVETRDSEIYEKVYEAIYNLPDVDASGLIISVKDGEVTLSGNVPSLKMKWAVESPIADINGVWEIYNNIQVKEEDSPLNITNH